VTERRRLITVLLLYLGFLAALAYHILVNFINTGSGASAGWYLYAVITPEVVLAILGLKALRRGGNVLFLVIVICFVALDLYATNWILVPYYTGLISHSSSGTLQSFHPANAAIGIKEVLHRLTANRPAFITENVILVSWALFVAGTLSTLYLALRYGRVSKIDTTPGQRLPLF
jgi:hypothetical protein